MRRQLRGIALIIFGIMLIIGESSINAILWNFGIGLSIAWALFGVLVGIAGLVVAFLGDGK